MGHSTPECIQIRDHPRLGRRPLHQEIANQLRARILNETFPEATRLRVRELARSQRVSVASAEMAYRSLEEQGLVERIDEETYRLARLSKEHRRELARRQLFDHLREQELSMVELELARDIQCRLLPPARVDGTGFVVASRSEPAHFMTGDFHDVILFADGSVGVFVADVAGKGMGASLIMASVKAILPFVAGDAGVAETLDGLNHRLCQDLGRREFVAMAFARFDPESGEVTMANAGLPEPWIIGEHSKPRAVEVGGDRLPLGIRSGVSYESVTVKMAPGERLLFVTDGIPESPTGAGEPIGYERWRLMLAESCMYGVWNDIDDWLDVLLERFQSVVAAESADDRTIVVLERRPGSKLTILEREEP